MNTNYDSIIETIINIFSIKNGKLCVLLFKKKKEPYKGYWILPTSYLNSSETIDDNIKNMIYDRIGLTNVYYELCSLYSDLNRDDSARIVGISYVGLISEIFIYQLNNLADSEWFDIDKIPKLGYDHNIILNDSINYLKQKVMCINYLKELFPSSFSIPEIQKIYEQILGGNIDRRNFRKKLLNLDILESISDKDSNVIGRPAKLYRFKENIDNKFLDR